MRSPAEIEFSLQGYEQLLDAVRAAGYEFCDFDDPHRFDRERVCLLRHDVDADLGRSLAMARVEQRLGVRATYFLMLRSAIYNLLSRVNDRMARELLGLGHAIGLHYDANYGPVNGRDLVEDVAFEAAFMAGMFGTEIGAVSFHQPAPEQVESNQEFPGLVSTYRDADLEGFVYLSDSNREWRVDPLELLADPPPRLQLLVHPMWWGGEPAEHDSQTTWDAVLDAKFELMQDQLCETERGYGPRRTIAISKGERE